MSRPPLDVTTRAQIIGPLGELRREPGRSLVFLAHDPAVVRAVGDRAAVLRSGRSVERGPVDSV
ncbi:hypothetical protein ACGFWI_17955 [Streptomyces sp. NPDC048434]|uniref:hypothetical protein n=1 Tax=Streptomyces sp. NPDC048434 TaxID=3365549 RepID=UPI003724C154